MDETEGLTLSMALSRSSWSDVRAVNQMSTSDGSRPASRVDPRERVVDHLGQEPGAGHDPVPDPAAQVQHLRALGADGDGDARAHRRGGPAHPLRPSLIRGLALGQELPDAGHVVLDARA